MRSPAGSLKQHALLTKQMAELLCKSFRDSKDTTLKSVSYSLLLMQNGDNAERAITASWVSEALYDAIMTKYGRVGPDVVDGRACLQVLGDTTKAGYIVDTIVQCLTAVDADDKEIDRSIAAKYAIPIVRSWLEASN